MKINWKWAGFVGVVTLALAVIFNSAFFRKYSLTLGADLGLKPSVSGVILGIFFLFIVIVLCRVANSIYGKPFRLEENTGDRRKMPGKGGGKGGFHKK